MDKFPFKLWRVDGIVVSIGLSKRDRWLPEGECIRMSKHLSDIELQVRDGVCVGDGELKDETLSDLH